MFLLILKVLFSFQKDDFKIVFYNENSTKNLIAIFKYNVNVEISM